MPHKPCYLKAHSGTTYFAPCQGCIDQDACETEYQLGASDAKEQTSGSTP